jgi:hypothetical protein
VGFINIDKIQKTLIDIIIYILEYKIILIREISIFLHNHKWQLLRLFLNNFILRILVALIVIFVVAIALTNFNAVSVGLNHTRNKISGT